MKDKNKFDEEEYDDLDEEEDADLDKELDEEESEKDGWSSSNYDEE